MVNCCINPACTAEFRLLRTGDVYAVERPGAGPEFVWLCSVCAPDYELYLGPGGAVSARRRSAAEDSASSPQGAVIRLVERGASGAPLHRPAVADAHPVSGQSGDRGSYARSASL